MFHLSRAWSERQMQYCQVAHCQRDKYINRIYMPEICSCFVSSQSHHNWLCLIQFALNNCKICCNSPSVSCNADEMTLCNALCKKFYFLYALFYFYHSILLLHMLFYISYTLNLYRILHVVLRFYWCNWLLGLTDFCILWQVVW